MIIIDGSSTFVNGFLKIILHIKLGRRQLEPTADYRIFIHLTLTLATLASHES